MDVNGSYNKKMKQIKIKVTEKMQKEMNEIRRKVDLPEEPIQEKYEVEALFG